MAESTRNWMTCDDLPQQLRSLRIKGRVNDRKLRQFLTGCCRSVWAHLEPEGKEAVEVAEGLADSSVTVRNVAEVHARAQRAYDRTIQQAQEGNYQGNRGIKMGRVVTATESAVTIVSDDLDNALEVIFDPKNYAFEGVIPKRKLKRLANCVLGNLSGKISLEPAWLTYDVTSITQGIYEQNGFNHMLVLADALEEAGCTQKEILKHCRGKGEHARGCWVIDLLLRKK